MFSPAMTRLIIDPENITDEPVENRKMAVEKHLFQYSILDHEKIMSDYSFFSRVFKNFQRAFSVLASQTR